MTPAPATAQEPHQQIQYRSISRRVQPEAETDNTFIEKVKDYVRHGGYEIEYVEIPRVNNLKDVISEKEIQEEQILGLQISNYKTVQQFLSSDENVKNDQLNEAITPRSCR